MDRKLIVTHHAPDLDAVTSVWLLKRFDAQDFATAHIAFVNPGETISEQEASEQGFKANEVVHVDTGMGEFDHHQKERANDQTCAATLVYDHLLKIHPELKNDLALKKIVDFALEIDHFKEIYWPDANDTKHNLMIHELIRGIEFTDPHNDDSQIHFGMTCLDSAYAILTQSTKAEEIIKEKGMPFEIKAGKALALETRNGDSIKIAQKMGYVLVVKKDPKLGHINIKVRPDADMDLKELHQKITSADHIGTWFYHGSGKMLINGSRKHRDQTPSPLELGEVVTFIKDIYGK